MMNIQKEPSGVDFLPADAFKARVDNCLEVN